MAVKYANIDKLEEDLTAIADALRAKNGSSEELTFPNDFIEQANHIYGVKDYTDFSQPVGELYSEAASVGWFGCCYNRTGITSLNFPNATSLVKQGWWNCTAINSVYAPKVTFVAERAISGCNGLVNLVLPKCWTIGNYGITSSNLIKLDLGGATTTPTGDKAQSSLGFLTYALNGNSKLNTLILRHAQVLPLMNTNNCFGDTCFASGKTGGTLYVPSDLITSYEAETTWATLLGYPNNQILPIEDSIYENYYADGSEIS